MTKMLGIYSKGFLENVPIEELPPLLPCSSKIQSVMTVLL
jgi:hypothetical protein